MTRTICIANQKGGVGKTTTAINLATCIAAIGRKVLVIDLDPQGNASTGLGLDKNKRDIGSYDVLLGRAPFASAIQPSAIKGLSVIPATPDLAAIEIELVDMERREFRLLDAMQKYFTDIGNASGEYDFILIDCPPSLGLITLNALVAAAALIVPLQCEFFALEGLSQLVRTVERIKSK